LAGPGVLRERHLEPLLPPPERGELIMAVGCIANDRLLVAKGGSMARAGRGPNASNAEGAPDVAETELVRVSLDGHEEPSTMPVRVGFAPWRAAGRLSPDGRLLLAQAREIGAAEIEVLDLEDGSRYVLDGVDLGLWSWLADGRLIWAEDRAADVPPRIRAWRPGGEPTTFEIDAPGSSHASLERSPDARRVLVRASHRDGDAFVVDLLAVLDPTSGLWTTIPGFDLDGGEGWSWGEWASSSSLVLQSPGRRSRLVAVDP
jgi:hypothetical protein